MIGRSLNADLRKMKGTSVILAHLLIPIITSVIFLIYYFFSPWNENMKVIAFYQAIGAGLPVLIGIFTASVMEQEQNAGDFQNLLSLPDKPAAFLSKLLMLLVFVSVLYPIDSNHIRNWIWKNRIKRYRNHERMYICSIAAVGKQCSTLSVAADSGFSVWKRGIHWSRDYIRTDQCIDAYRTWRLCVEICICLLDG